jgi:hypothetical protein
MEDEMSFWLRLFATAYVHAVLAACSLHSGAPSPSFALQNHQSQAAPLVSISDTQLDRLVSPQITGSERVVTLDLLRKIFAASPALIRSSLLNSKGKIIIIDASNKVHVNDPCLRQSFGVDAPVPANVTLTWTKPGRRLICPPCCQYLDY